VRSGAACDDLLFRSGRRTRPSRAGRAARPCSPSSRRAAHRIGNGGEQLTPKGAGPKGVPLRAAGRVRTPLFQRARAHLNVLLRQRARHPVPARHDRLRRGARVADVRSSGRAGAPISRRQLGGSLCAGGNGAAAGPTMDWTRVPTAPRRWVEIISVPHSGRFARCLHRRRPSRRHCWGWRGRPRS
jgi:hypothetical protein